MFNIIVATALVLVTTAVYGAEINTGSDNELRLGISSTSNLFAEQSYRLAEWELGTLQTGQRFTGTIGLVSPIDLQAPWLQSDPGLELEIYAAPSGSTGSKYGVRADLYRDSIVGDIVYRYEGFQIFAGYRIAGEGGEAGSSPERFSPPARGSAKPGAQESLELHYQLRFRITIPIRRNNNGYD